MIKTKKYKVTFKTRLILLRMWCMWNLHPAYRDANRTAKAYFREHPEAHIYDATGDARLRKKYPNHPDVMRAREREAE
jgi:hypothetical protein